MADIIYYVNEELGTVVAKMPTFEDDFYREITAFCKKQFEFKGALLATGFSSYFHRKTFELLHGKYESALVNLCGKAHCNYEHGETFDEVKGKELAKQRLMVKVFSLRRNIFNDRLFAIDEDIVEPIQGRGLHYINHLFMYIDNLDSLEAAY